MGIRDLWTRITQQKGRGRKEIPLEYSSSKKKIWWSSLITFCGSDSGDCGKKKSMVTDKSKGRSTEIPHRRGGGEKGRLRAKTSQKLNRVTKGG